MTHEITRRRFIEHTALMGGVATLGSIWAGEPATVASEPLKPIGQAKGIHPGRVVWVHDPQVTDWKGPQDGHWYEANHTKQDRVDAMMARAVCDLTGESTVARAWDKLFRHFNRKQGRPEASYRPAEKIVIKPNWVGMIWREGSVDPDNVHAREASGLHEHGASDDRCTPAPTRRGRGRGRVRHQRVRHVGVPGL